MNITKKSGYTMEKEGFDPHMAKGNVLQVEDIPTLGAFGLGQVEGGVGADIEMTPELLEKFERISSGEFEIDAASDVAEICVDERHELNGAPRNQARSAGGPVGNAHAHDLAAGPLNQDEDELTVVRTSSKKQQDAGANVLPHTDDHSACGCGQCMKAPTIYEVFAHKMDKVTAAVNALSAVAAEQGNWSPSLTPEDAEKLSAKAKMRLAQPNFFAEDRSSVLATATGPEGKIETLTGAHNARVVLWVTAPDKTQDVSRIASELDMDCFIVNAWSLRKTAETLNVTGYDDETKLTAAALASLNVATVDVLCSANMPVLVV